MSCKKIKDCLKCLARTCAWEVGEKVCSHVAKGGKKWLRPGQDADHCPSPASRNECEEASSMQVGLAAMIGSAVTVALAAGAWFLMNQLAKHRAKCAPAAKPAPALPEEVLAYSGRGRGQRVAPLSSNN